MSSFGQRMRSSIDCLCYSAGNTANALLHSPIAFNFFIRLHAWSQNFALFSLVPIVVVRHVLFYFPPSSSAGWSGKQRIQVQSSWKSISVSTQSPLATVIWNYIAKSFMLQCILSSFHNVRILTAAEPILKINPSCKHIKM